LPIVVIDAVPSSLFTVLAAFEVLADVPALKYVVRALSDDPDKQLAFLFLGLRLASFVLSITFLDHCERLLVRLSPPSREEKLSRPEFIFDEAAREPSSAVDLIEKEQARIVERLPLFLEKLREEHEVAEFPEYGQLHEATVVLGREISQFSHEVFFQSPSGETSELLIRVVNRHDMVMRLEENIFNFTRELDGWTVPEDLRRVRSEMVESLHAVIMMGIDAANSRDIDDLDRFIAITGDKSSVMEKVRGACLSEKSEVRVADRSTILYVTDLFQRSVWLLHQWALVVRAGRGA
jgi:phosphate:Na+ symporter